MFKITIVGIDACLLTVVEDVGEIEYIDQDRRIFTASFDGCKVKVKGERVLIKNPEKRATLILYQHEFEEISIK